MATTKTSNKTTSTVSATPKGTESKVGINSNNELLEMMKQMQAQIQNLSTELSSTKAELVEAKEKTEKIEGKTPEVSNVLTAEYVQPIQTYTSSLAEQYIEKIANRKSDQEVTIVHNREIVGGGTTHIKLQGIEIDFQHIGQKRLLSWSQFQECASKYAGFFKREIILVDDEDRWAAEMYQLPCVKRNGAVLTRTELDKVGKLSIEKLTQLYNSLTEEDKVFLLNYWMGQCYNNNPDFYNRTKVETLNALSGKGTFDVILTYMNGEFVRKKNTEEAETLKKTSPNINPGGGNFIGKVN